jgi:nicotinamidase/pyrazinamidase
MSTAFLDIDTQLDFVYPSGALYAPGAERIVSTIARLNRYALEQGIPVISTVDAHSENDPEFQVWPHHCVAGTWGQRKPESTLLPKGAHQIIAEKQTVHTLDAPNVRRALERVGAQSYFVYGVVTEICVLHAVRGLLEMGAKVTVVTDAIQALNPEDGARALDEMRTRGASFISHVNVSVP